MEPHQKTVHPCPFCHKETLEVLTWPGHTAVRSSRSAVAKSTTYVKKPEGFELLSESCSNCGRSANEIKKAWKEGVNEMGKDQRRRRIDDLKKIGMSGIIRTK